MRKLPIIILLTLLCLVSCKTEKVVTEYIEVPKVSIVEKHDTLVDSVYTHDSITVYQRGDTVFSEKYRDRWRTQYITREVNKTDTVYSVIEKPIMYKVHVEKPLSKWQKLQMYLGRAMFGILGIIGIGGITWIILNLKRK